jgi:hypothetical protein
METMSTDESKMIVQIQASKYKEAFIGRRKNGHDHPSLDVVENYLNYGITLEEFLIGTYTENKNMAFMKGIIYKGVDVIIIRQINWYFDHPNKCNLFTIIELAWLHDTGYNFILDNQSTGYVRAQSTEYFSAVDDIALYDYFADRGRLRRKFNELKEFFENLFVNQE